MITGVRTLEGVRLSEKICTRIKICELEENGTEVRQCKKWTAVNNAVRDFFTFLFLVWFITSLHAQQLTACLVSLIDNTLGIIELTNWSISHSTWLKLHYAWVSPRNSLGEMSFLICFLLSAEKVANNDSLNPALKV